MEHDGDDLPHAVVARVAAAGLAEITASCSSDARTAASPVAIASSAQRTS
ncbi:hypothetical protein [Streptomyces sp. DASNCL29]|nr:hypothetical protein [Streptomyces sp. DASNCL29]